jgi:hypothetical protein
LFGKGTDARIRVPADACLSVVAAAAVPAPSDVSRREISQAGRISFLQKTAPVLTASRPFDAR